MSPKSPTQRILVADRISESGVQRLRQGEGFEVDVRTGMEATELATEIRGYDALVVRSATKVTAEILEDPGRLKVIGRAGTGVDNIDLEAATRAGVVVLNTPGGNSVAAAELTVSLLLAMVRNIPQANESLRAGRWERGAYVGVEVADKVLGVIGLGRVGREVARAARGLRMTVLGYDPYVSGQSVQDVGVSCVSLEEVQKRADIITLHLPLTEETRHVIDAAALARMKKGVRLVNCARGGLVDEAALLAALESDQVAGAALDVFQTEPPSDRRLVEHPRVISTPHLGASTLEAQERVGTLVAEKICDFLETGTILDAVNFPSISREEHRVLRPIMDLAERLGRFLGQVNEAGIRSVEFCCYGEFTERPLRPMAMAAVKGLLSPMLAEAVSYVNALAVAEERGITVGEARSHESTPYAGLLRLKLTTDSGQASVAGTLFTAEHPRLVEVDGVQVECRPAGHLLFFRNRDVPGVVGRIGTILGSAGVNIAGIHLGRTAGDGTAVSIVSMDSAMPRATLKEIQDLPEIAVARALNV